MARTRKQLDKAGDLYERAAEILRRVLGERNQFYAAQLSGSGRIYVMRGEYRRGEAILRKALSIFRAVIPAERYTGITQIRLASALAGQKRYVEAEKEGLDAYATLQRKTAPDSIEQKSARKEVYDIYMAMKEPEKANHFR